MSHQKERLASFLKRELGLFFMRRFPHDPKIFLSVVDVVLNSSSEEASVYVSAFPADRAGKILQELKFYRGEARKFLVSRMRRRKFPKIKFLPAETERSMRLEKLLEKVKND